MRFLALAISILGACLMTILRGLRFDCGRNIRINKDPYIGNGHLLPLLMRRAEGLHYEGLDISTTMAAEARFNTRLMLRKR